MPDCRLCGQPLRPGNVKIVRPRKGRPYRVCRTCPKNPASVSACVPAVSTPAKNARTEKKNEASATVRKIAPVPEQPALPAPDYRLFMRQAMAEKLRRASARLPASLPITIEVIPVRSLDIETQPDAFEGLVEVEIKSQ